MSRYTFETRLFAILRWVVIAFLVLITLFPFWYMLMMSFTPIQELQLNPGRLFPALDTLTTSTYVDVLRSREDGGQGFARFMLNSFIAASVTTLVTLLLVIPAAYAVSRLRFPGRKQLSALFLLIYMFPAIILAIPLFVAFSAMGIRESLVGLVIVYIALTIPVSIYMLRQYFDTIPPSIDEAAIMDGATRLQIMTRITVPLARPTIISTGLYIFMIAWNEFLFALLFLVAAPNLWTVSLGLSQLADGIEISKTVLMAGSVLLTIPVIVIYAVAERGLTEGLTAGADKG
ncbi:carbohydrate ABC transporter permease [Brachybacterium muris]|uniref:carbohydrate ABC transporter permease n=1 Tax=Brachybacterium muris TaxID=219301 RepID=UPI000DB01504|nr:carbohydrate ABC transporter permease [Brachybacterium muris]MCT1997696.1 carbohydrate ABC transporter permease [Brachybacterium muris]MCT2177907.1 carbohydrate ABC transporter permease [Brachybacterium muris]MCT2261992.1 carbohydrate ABC transporter permease [Brachybacterium muris]PZP16290.1 MAG: transporter [Brachybacterium faecium]